MLNRVSLNTIGLNRIGLNRIGKPSRGSSERPYIDPEVLASLKAVCICYGKSNEDPDRAIVKNLVDPDNPFVISNAAFKLNSGFGKYEDDFTNWVAETGTKLTSDKITNSNPTKNWIAYRSSGVEFKEMHIRILGIPDNGALYFQRPAADGGPIKMFNGDNNIPAFTSTGICGFFINNLTGLGWSNLVIEQIPSFEDAFVTDGIDDLITSTKTVQEMLGGSTEFTAVSMVHLISSGQDVGGNAYTNYIRTSDNYWTSNRVSNVGKTGIYGYSFKQGTPTVINNILGDKNDYTTEKSDIVSDSSVSDLFRAKFSVEGFEHVIYGAVHVSSVAWYWTIIANKVLTTDQINQVIAYFNLDRTLRPDIYCNIAKQGITNENHAEFGDKLIDFSGNGRDIQMYNLAWKGGSGVAAKQYETFKDWTSESSSTSIIKQIDEFTRIVESTTNGYWVSRIERDSDLDKVYSPINVYLYQDNNFLVHECKYEVDGVKYAIPINEPVGKGYHKLEMYTKDRYTELPENAENVVLSEWYFPKSTKGSIKYSIIPSCKGGILLDGINDFGKVTGMPIYKDYTFIAEREFLSTPDDFVNAGSIVSKMHKIGEGSFIFETFTKTQAREVSFSSTTDFDNPNTERIISYQSKYSYNGKALTAGQVEDRDVMWLGTIRDNDTRFINAAIYFLMSFPYSMSEFLIERQLKKHKLGTLYPDMVEFRPIVKSNLPYSSISYSVNPGEYISVDSMVTITVTLPNTSDKLMEVSCNAISDISISGDNGVYEITGKVGKSPQKINMIISSYLTMLSNSTLISNETLIKNE